MIKEIKQNRLKEEINRYLSGLFHTQNKYNDLLYYNKRLVINISHIDYKVRIHKIILDSSLKFNNDYELLLDVMKERFKMKKYPIKFM